MTNVQPLVIDGGLSADVVSALEVRRPEAIVFKYGDFGDYSWLVPFRSFIRSLVFLQPVPNGRFLEQFELLEKLSVCEEKAQLDLAALRGLRELNVVWKKKYNPAFAAGLPLKHLQITSWGHQTLEPLGGAVELESCLFTGGSLVSLDGVEQWLRLADLDIRYQRGLESISACADSKSISRINFCNLPALSRLEAFAQMEALASLNLENLASVTSIEPAFVGAARKAIDIKNVGKNFPVPSLYLSACPALEWLTLLNVVERVDWAALLSMQSLKHIWLAYRCEPNPYEVVPGLAKQAGRVVTYQSGSHNRGRRSWHDLKLA